jgi:hypothetical protein
VSTPPSRVVPRLKTSLTFHLPDGWRGEVIDLSATGLRIRCVAVLEAGLQFDGALELPGGERLKLPVRVVWTRPPDHAGYVPGEVGFELIEPPVEYHQAVARLFADSDGA